MGKKDLSERDICTKFITPALVKAGWDLQKQILEEVFFTDGKIYVRGKLTARGERKRADYILYYQDNPIAIIEAKDNKHSIGSGIQQALGYAIILDIPCVFSSNGDGFLFHDKTANDFKIESELSLDEFPSPEVLWNKYKKYKGIVNVEGEKIALQKYFSDGSGRKPRYYQQNAINRTVEAIANGQNRILLVMATGTGKTYTAFQIIYRLWKSRSKKRILFLADRTALIDQTRKGDFKHFKDKMTIIKKKVLEFNNGKEELISNKKRGIDTSDKAYEIFLGLYQGLTNNEPGIEDAYKDFSPDFFDLIIIDECHRGSANEDSSWREILRYFKTATHVGLTATPRETKETSNTEYFGDPVYTYSLKQGIDDGFLAPYKVIRVALNVDTEGYRPQRGKTDKEGNLIEDRIYNRRDFDKKLVIDERTDIVAQKVTEYLKGLDRFAKTIIFCVDIDHAERMRNAIAKHNADLVSENYKYVMQITGDNDEGKRELDNFINPEEVYPVVATTSELMTTGVDAQTCKVIVLDTNINSMTKFKQIVGRGTRINEEFDKLYFTILDFRNATDNFADPTFDGDPLRVKPITEEADLTHIIDEEENDYSPIIDDISGEEIVLEPKIRNPLNEPETEYKKREKQYINGIDVSVLISRELYFDSNGKPITVSLQDHTKEIIKGKYASLNDFLLIWNQADRKEAIIKELQEQGILVEALYEAVDKDVDLFDLICHVAYDQKPLTRQERANNVKKRNYFTKYEANTRKVLETLLDKYADEGVENIESIEVLRVKPFDDFGSTLEIVNGIFGGKSSYMEAVKDLETELYRKV
ncbi:type I restriction enzyme R subunit [Flavobacterium sp. 270]|uniref:EcoAI/FtnUII family type I restriction enzme subunit R n=1 Tax=Flavobacterium sp. 270 TaxID=2512114 RepID=UPI001066CA57|nr:DEAD/DEAH box helicase family protein [Flavobacterium sp. 270]TDW51572.1 type I restriction enzyme R subunit [Flavobacterium sp. 270]